MPTQQRYYTPEEYLAQQEVAQFRSEYRNGEIVPMTGGSINHNQITGNIYALLKFALRGTAFKPYISNLRVWIPQYRQYTYPDVFVIQDQPVFQEPRRDTVLNPCVIVEVLSKSTRSYDLTNKFRYYRSIPAFREYILVDQYEAAVDQYIKTNEDTWLFRGYEDNNQIKIAAVDVELLFADIYEDVDFNLEDGG